MNKTYRLIWNDFTRTWVAVSEIARARGKRASGAVLLAAAGTADPQSRLYDATNPTLSTRLPGRWPRGGARYGGEVKTSGVAHNLIIASP